MRFKINHRDQGETTSETREKKLNKLNVFLSERSNFCKMKHHVGQDTFEKGEDTIGHYQEERRCRRFYVCTIYLSAPV